MQNIDLSSHQVKLIGDFAPTDTATNWLDENALNLPSAIIHQVVDGNRIPVGWNKYGHLIAPTNTTDFSQMVISTDPVKAKHFDVILYRDSNGGTFIRSNHPELHELSVTSQSYWNKVDYLKNGLSPFAIRAELAYQWGYALLEEWLGIDHLSSNVLIPTINNQFAMVKIDNKYRLAEFDLNDNLVYFYQFFYFDELQPNTNKEQEIYGTPVNLSGKNGLYARLNKESNLYDIYNPLRTIIQELAREGMDSESIYNILKSQNRTTEFLVNLNKLLGLNN